MRASHQTALAFAGSALVGLALRSHDCFVVDGAPRCLTVFQNPTLLFHPNNHLLYLVNVLVWTRMASALGFNLSDPLQFIVTVATMNCLAAAVCLTVLFWILRKVTESWKLATIVCVGYGLTTAFLAQAVNPNEPMVGAFWSFLAIALAILSLRNRRLWPIVVCGLLFALAMATYRTMVFLAPAASVVIVSPAGSDESWKPWRSGQPLRLAVLGISFVLGCVLIFGWAYSHMGVARADMLAKFLHQDDARVYLDVSAYQWLKLPLGLIRNCFPVLPLYNGMRGFLHGARSVLISVTALVVVLWLCLFYCVYTLLKQRRSLNQVEQTAALAAAAGLMFTMIPLLSWNPHYGKFWIQPLACMAVLVAIAFRRFEGVSRRVLLMSRVASVLFLGGVLFNLGWAFRAHRHQPFEFEEAHKVKQLVGDRDLVILDRGSDSVSVMYAYLWADEKQLFPIMDKATLHGVGIIGEIDTAIRRTWEAGGKVYFLGVVDLPKPTWDAFLDQRCGVPYASFDRYRSAVRLKAHFTSRGGPTSLWELAAPKQQSDPALLQSPNS
jgi:hypothetical protein